MHSNNSYIYIYATLSERALRMAAGAIIHQYMEEVVRVLLFFDTVKGTFASICIVLMKSYSQAMWWYDMLGCCDLFFLWFEMISCVCFCFVLTRHTLLTSFLDNFKTIALAKSFRIWLRSCSCLIFLSLGTSVIESMTWNDLSDFAHTRSACPKIERSSKNGRICAIV